MKRIKTLLLASTVLVLSACGKTEFTDAQITEGARSQASWYAEAIGYSGWQRLEITSMPMNFKERTFTLTGNVMHKDVWGRSRSDWINCEGYWTVGKVRSDQIDYTFTCRGDNGAMGTHTLWYRPNA